MLVPSCFNSKVSVSLHQKEIAAVDVNLYLLLTVLDHFVASVKKGDQHSHRCDSSIDHKKTGTTGLITVKTSV